MDLLNELESVRKGLSGKEILEQSTSFVFQNNKVMAYNDEIAAIANSCLDIEGAVDADSLLKLLNKIKDEKIKVGVDDDELKIKGKKFNTGIKFDSEVKLPMENLNIDLDTDFQELPENFSQLAKLACLTASSSMNMPLLTCVHIEKDKIESCDNDRITICKLDRDTKLNILVPAKNLLEIVKEKVVGVSLDESWIHFKTDEDTILSSRIFNEEYVDLESLLPEDEGEKVKFQQEVENIINRASVFSTDAITAEKTIYLNIKDGKLEISTQNENGWYKEKAKVETDEDFAFSINADFLKDVLKMSNEISIIDDVLMFEDDNAQHLIKLETEENKKEGEV